VYRLRQEAGRLRCQVHVRAEACSARQGAQRWRGVRDGGVAGESLKREGCLYTDRFRVVSVVTR